MEDAVERWNGDESERSTGAGEGPAASSVTGRLRGGVVQLDGNVVDGVNQMLKDRINVAERRPTFHQER